MVKSCCALNCKETYRKGKNISFHGFPKDPERRRLWEKLIGRENFVATEYTQICSNHFTADCYVPNKYGGKNTCLKDDAVPTIFDHPSHFLKKVDKRKKPNKMCSSENTPVQDEECSPAPKRMKYVGDFKEEDMESPITAKAFFSTAYDEVKNKAKEIKNLQQKERRLKRRLESLQEVINDLKLNGYISEHTMGILETNISGPYSSGAKLKNVDPNLPSTSTQEEVLPDIGSYQGFPEAEQQFADPVYDPNIVIKQEVIETEVDPSAILEGVPIETSPTKAAENPHQEIITPNAPETLLQETANAQISESLSTPTNTYMDTSNNGENILPATRSHTEITAPITLMKITEGRSIVPVESPKHHKKGGFRKVFVKKGGKRSPSPSGSSSDEGESSRRSKDKFDVYGEFIASKLRDLDKRSCAFVQTAIADLIFEAELGRFLSTGDKSIFATKTQEILKNMPPPCETKA